MLDEREIRSILASHGLDPRRSLGQNFVADPATVERIAELARVGPGDRVVEIGPGLGSLTLALAATGAEVTVVEKDEHLVPVLTDVLAAKGAAGVRVVSADALDLDWSELLAGDGAPWTLVANLPYNVAVPLIMGVLRAAPQIDRLLVMVQREVAERLAATPVGRTVGVPSIKVAWFASAEIVGLVPPEVFVPVPRVESALVEIVRRPPPPVSVGPDEVFALVERAYRQRRKMLRVTIGGVVPPEAFEQAGVEPTARPEELDVRRWAALAEASRVPRSAG